MYGVTMLGLETQPRSIANVAAEVISDECWSFDDRLKMEAQSMIQRLQ